MRKALPAATAHDTTKRPASPHFSTMPTRRSTKRKSAGDGELHDDAPTPVAPRPEKRPRRASTKPGSGSAKAPAKAPAKAKPKAKAATKRKASRGSNGRAKTSGRGGSGSGSGSNDAAPKTKARGSKKKAAPKTFKDQILAILADADAPIGLPSIKKELIARFGREDSSRFRKSVGTALKALEASNLPNFGKVGGSYHAGADSAVGRRIAAEAAEAKVKEERELAGHILCPWCQTWNDGLKSWDTEMPDARGSAYTCTAPVEEGAQGCTKKFYLSINDRDQIYGSKKYRRNPY